MSITCPHCEDRPGHDIKPWNRWRWLTAHIVAQHSASKVKTIEGNYETVEKSLQKRLG